MLRNLQDQYLHEDSYLAGYAVHNLQTQGRRHPEAPHNLRTDFQRDRDRVLHSKSFRRLEYKTQVFLNGTGDHLRTRLTHTIEVAAICRTIARALRLNEDLAETIALAHDLGHTPFGHSGERTMNRLMKKYGGFDHNLQALRIVDILETKYPDYDGINLTWEVRAGLIKHRHEDQSRLDGKILSPQPSLESQVADLGDDLTYYGHDVDDGLDAGLINEDMLEDIEIWKRASGNAIAHGLKKGEERFRSFTVRCLIDMMVGNAVEYSHQNLSHHNIQTLEAAKTYPERLISFSPEFEVMTNQLRDFLYKNVYFHPEVATINQYTEERIQGLFEVYTRNPELMGHSAKTRLEIDGKERTAADYIAGMTDRFANQEFERFFRK
jgi:dGTPase